MSTDKLFRRSLIFLVGLFVMAFGVALSVKANLGVSPISCIPYIFSERFPLSMGQTTILFNVLLILLQIVVKRRNYELIQLIQFPVVLVFGFFTDFTLYLVRDLEMGHYPGQLLLCLLSCVVIGFGVFLEVKAKVTYLAGEGLSLAIADTFNVEFGKAKVGVDSTMVLLGVLSSFLFFHRLLGVREGTIIAALLVGVLAKYYSSRIRIFDGLLQSASSPDNLDLLVPANETPLVITISREYGSGGHAIGKLVAEKLGISFFDKELVDLTARESGLTPEYIKEHEQRLKHSLFFSLYEQNYAYVNEKLPPLDVMFLVQSKILRDVSEKASCVIVGRCANFVLKDHTRRFSAFIHASPEIRKQRYIDEYQGNPEDAEKEVEQMETERNHYCKHFTGKERGLVKDYDLTIDRSRLSVEAAADLIVKAVREMK